MHVAVQSHKYDIMACVALNRSTTFLQNWRHIMEIILLYILFMAMAQMPFGYAHGVVLTLFMHDVFNDSKLKER